MAKLSSRRFICPLPTFSFCVAYMTKRKSKGKRGSTVGNLKYGEFPFFDGEPNGVAEELDNMRTALKVIYTWAAVEREAMNHRHVMQLIERTLNMKETT